MRIGPVLLVVIAGCSLILAPPDPRVELATDREQYSVGGEGVLRIVNLEADTLAYDCLFLDRRVAQEWEQIGSYGECIIIAYPTAILAPHDTVTRGFTIDRPLEAGHEYRFFLALQRLGRRGDRTFVHSNAFSVVE